MNALDIVKRYLTDHNFDGLAMKNCGCGLDDLAPCGEVDVRQCCPAKVRVLGPDEYIGDYGPGDTFYYSTMPPRPQGA
jgi:hypothetical protein